MNFNTRYRAKDLKPLQSSAVVWLPEFKSEGKVAEKKEPRSCTVQSTNGAYRRNSRHLIPLPAPTTEGNDSRDRTKSPSPIPQKVQDSSIPSQAKSQESTVRIRSGKNSRPSQRLELDM